MRRVSKRFERLTESYWEMRYEVSQLRWRMAQLDPEQSDPNAVPPTGATASVSLSSLKR